MFSHLCWLPVYKSCIQAGIVLLENITKNHNNVKQGLEIKTISFIQIPS